MFEVFGVSTKQGTGIKMFDLFLGEMSRFALASGLTQDAMWDVLTKYQKIETWNLPQVGPPLELVIQKLQGHAACFTIKPCQNKSGKCWESTWTNDQFRQLFLWGSIRVLGGEDWWLLVLGISLFEIFYSGFLIIRHELPTNHQEMELNIWERPNGQGILEQLVSRCLRT